MSRRQNWIAVSVFLATVLTGGGYYEFVNGILCVLLACALLFVKCQKNGNIGNETYLIFPFLLVIVYLLPCFYGTDPAMGVTGMVKKIFLMLFAAALSLVPLKQRRKLLLWFPEAVTAVTVLAVPCVCIPGVKDYIIMAGRFAGTFGNANAYALFLLLALVVMAERDHKKGWMEFLEMVVLITALWFTGSRFTWVLALAAGVVLGVRHRTDAGIRVAWGVTGLLFAALSAGTLFLGKTISLGRMFHTNFSTFYGRILYWQDALVLLKKHPFGMGYLGYFYEQTQVQTGVYTVRFVHNGILQWALDGGVIAALLLTAVLIRSLVNKRRSWMQKMLIALILFHGMMEFDMEYSGIGSLLLWILSCEKETIGLNLQGRMPIKVQKGVLAVTSVVCLYITVPLTLYAAGKYKEAVSWYPVYTDALTTCLAQETDPGRAEGYADRILEYNDTIALAYDAKAEIEYEKGNLDLFCRYKEKAIQRNKFDPQEYTRYLVMLNDFLDDSRYQENAWKKMREIPVMIQRNKGTVSTLGKKIDDKVEIDLPDEILSQLNQ